MTQSELNRAVAAATGESLRTIRQRGFSIAHPLLREHDPEPYGIEDKILDGNNISSRGRSEHAQDFRT